MLDFYGFQRQGRGIAPSPEFARRAETWLAYGDHNYLRITRILRCLKLCGLEGYAGAFYQALKKVYAEHEREIDPETFRFWTRAIQD